MVSVPSDYGDLGSPPIEIKVFWSKLLEHLYFIFPLSLDKAISMSKEIEKSKDFKGELVK